MEDEQLSHEEWEEYLKLIKKYRDYQEGTYQSMSLEEKIDFFDGIHTERIPIFDEDAIPLGTLFDYGEITQEFTQHPEMFSLEDISKFMAMFDDNCFEISFMHDTLDVILSIVKFQGRDGVVFLLNHLSDVPEQGKEFGLWYGLLDLMRVDVVFSYLKEVITLVDSSVRELVRQIIDGEVPGVEGLLEYFEENKEYLKGNDLERIHELKEIISHTA